MYRKPIAKMSEGIDAPKERTNVAARAMPGKDMTMSQMRMMTSETHFRDTAAIAPTMDPTTSANAVAPRPIVSEYRAPYIIRESTSRPLSSVPNKNCPSGAWRASKMA